MSNKRIIVIDDDIDTLEILELILIEQGYEVVTGTDWPLLAEIESNPPALLLIDNWLRDRSGYDLCKQLKSTPRTSNIPVLLISATVNLEQTARNCKADGYICKPFDIIELIEKVNAMIKNT